MSADWIVNPRRAPRARIRCRARLVFAAGTLEAETEDVGSHGCQVVAPHAIPRGAPVELTIATDRLPEPLAVCGRVAWASPTPPFRLGIAFDEAWLELGARWATRYFAASGAPPQGRVPDRIRADAVVWLGPPPRFLVDFTRDEVLLLRAVGSGTSIGELRARLRERWAEAQRALFSLLAHQHLTLSRGASVHPESWRRILGALEASLAVEDLRAPLPPPGPARTRPPGDAGLPARTPVPGEGRATARSLDGGAGWIGPSSPAPDFQGAGVGWRTRRERPPEAQGCLDRAREELAAGRMGGALALLRRALALAPGDPEIAAELGRVAFGDRPASR